VVTELFPKDPSRNPTLEDAWQCFAKYDKNAVKAQKRFILQQKLILGLGVAATTLAVAYSTLDRIAETGNGGWLQPLANERLLQIMHGCVIVIPIVLSVLIAGSVKFNMGISWVMLRSSAEALKKEIFRYRLRVGEYFQEEGGNSDPRRDSRDVHMARKVKQVSKRLMETQVNQTGLEPYKGQLPPYAAEGDDGFSDLTPDEYVAYRVEDQFNYYQKKALRLSRELQRFQWLVYILGGVGTSLAAFGFDVWIAVSSALATSFASFLEFKRVETNLVSCNMAASDIYDIRTWWRALSDSARRQQANIEILVSSTEAVIQSENLGWVQEMRDALSEIYGDKTEAEHVQGLLGMGRAPVHPESDRLLSLDTAEDGHGSSEEQATSPEEDTQLTDTPTGVV
jgi:hypothetical protein